jgi:hypothetical protein
VRYVDCVDVVNTNSVASTLAITANINSDESQSYKEVLEDKETVKWLIVMNEELQYLEKNKTWDLVLLLRGIKSVGCQ